MNPPKKRNNTITEYALTEKNHVGNVTEQKEYYDLMTAIMVCLGEKDENCENDLLGLLDVLLSSDISAEKKKEILENEYDIPMSEKMEGEVERMCNLSDGVEQKGIQKGIKIGIEKGIEQGLEQSQRIIILNMLKENEPIEKICRYTQSEEDYVLRLKQEL